MYEISKLLFGLKIRILRINKTHSIINTISFFYYRNCRLTTIIFRNGTRENVLFGNTASPNPFSRLQSGSHFEALYTQYMYFRSVWSQPISMAILSLLIKTRNAWERSFYVERDAGLRFRRMEFARWILELHILRVPCVNCEKKIREKIGITLWRDILENFYYFIDRKIENLLFFIGSASLKKKIFITVYSKKDAKNAGKCFERIWGHFHCHKLKEYFEISKNY